MLRPLQSSAKASPLAWFERLARTPAAQRLFRPVARVPASVHAKLLVAFLMIVLLLILVGVAGLRALSAVNQHTVDLGKLQQKIAAYRQLQHDTTVQLYIVASAFRVPTETTLEATLRQLNQFGYDLDRLEHVANDEVVLIRRVQEEYEKFIQVVTRGVALIRAGRVAEGRELELSQVGPLADRLERLTNHLVNRAEADMVASTDASRAAYVSSRRFVVGFAAGSILLALLLGYAISWSLIGPVELIDARLRELASGDFSRRVEIPNRDELGTLATNLNHMNEELGRLYTQLEAASRHKSQFLATMSHELRTPLNAILGYTELIQDGIYGVIPERVRSVLVRIQRSGRHLLDLINDVLDMSRIEAGQFTLSRADYCLEDVVKAVVASMESLAAEKHLTLRASVAPDLPSGRGDVRRLTQVLLNLIGNAIKFTEAGEVGVEATMLDGQFLVAVTDTGPGIAEADHQRVFEEFQQGGGSTLRNKGGAGLGLAIARRIIELHGGRLWVESSLGEGSTFRFTIPLHITQTDV